jgi:hypothetical protein
MYNFKIENWVIKDDRELITFRLHKRGRITRDISTRYITLTAEQLYSLADNDGYREDDSRAVLHLAEGFACGGAPLLAGAACNDAEGPIRDDTNSK